MGEGKQVTGKPERAWESVGVPPTVTGGSAPLGIGLGLHGWFIVCFCLLLTVGILMELQL